MAQRIHVICHSYPGHSKEETHGLAELNKLLEDGWIVSKTEPMSAGRAGAATHEAFALCFILSK